jgi:cytochrome c2
MYHKMVCIVTKTNFKNRVMKKVLLFMVCVGLVNTTLAQSFEEGEKVFKQNCAACHKMDKKVVGPALQNVVADQGAEWVYEWVKNNQALRESGDSHANEVYAEFNGSAMPAYEWLGEPGLNNIVQYLTDWKGKQEAKTPVVVNTGGPTMVQQAPYVMPVWLRVFAIFVVGLVVITSFTAIKTTRIVAEAYIENQVTTTYLMKKQDLTPDELNEEFDGFIEGQVNARVDKKVKALKKDINDKLKGFK